MFKFLLSIMSMLLIGFFVLLSPVRAAPLLEAGKTSIYQRVIVHPGAKLFQNQNLTGQAKDVVPFSVFYVYQRSEKALLVGKSIDSSEGWLDIRKTAPWSQSLTLLFSPRTGRAPVLFFKSDKDLIQICNADDMSKQLNNLYTVAKNGLQKDNLPILASEPDDSKGAVSNKRFYIMPILAMKEVFNHVKFLKVASIDPGNLDAQDANQEKQAPSATMTASELKNAQKNCYCYCYGHFYFYASLYRTKQ